MTELITLTERDVSVEMGEQVDVCVCVSRVLINFAAININVHS